jgi:hypothetical protein
MKIQKRDDKFYNHLKGSDDYTFYHKPLNYREIYLEKSPLSLLVETHPTEHQESNAIKTNQSRDSKKITI